MFKQPLVKHIYTADPSAHVFKNRIYIYPSHDLDLEAQDNDEGDQYQMIDYHVLSQDHPEAPAVDHGEVLHVKDVPWAVSQMWAPDAAEKGGKYYLYFPAKAETGIFHIGVAVADKPEGPFTAQPEPIQGSFSIDPCVFKDDDGSHYILFGGIWGGQLQNWRTGSYLADGSLPNPDEPALSCKMAKLRPDMLEMDESPQDMVIQDENGAPLLEGDNERRFFEGPWMHKYNGLYYFSYSTGDTHTISYATAETPYGPFRYRGRILNPAIGWTTHHSIIEFEGRWFLYYHDASLSGGVNHKRCVKVQELFYNQDGTIKTLDP